MSLGIHRGAANLTCRKTQPNLSPSCFPYSIDIYDHLIYAFLPFFFLNRSHAQSIECQDWALYLCSFAFRFPVPFLSFYLFKRCSHYFYFSITFLYLFVLEVAPGRRPPRRSRKAL